MWPQLGGHLVVRTHPKPLGQDHEPASDELDGLADARGEADGVARADWTVVLRRTMSDDLLHLPV